MRMISRGDLNLEAYVDRLQDDYAEFGELFGNPDLRVAIISLRDDVLQIPKVDGEGRPLSVSERVNAFRDRLTNQEYLNGIGHRVFGFSTSLGSLSPLTRNHKIRHIEAEIIGSDVGDTLGRLYVRQRGTGYVRAVDNEDIYYRFPKRTAVLDPFFNGQRVFEARLYQNDRLRDRPYVNTNWELAFNQMDERVNQDVNLNSLTDIRLYLYYTDFTEL